MPTRACLLSIFFFSSETVVVAVEVIYLIVKPRLASRTAEPLAWMGINRGYLTEIERGKRDWSLTFLKAPQMVSLSLSSSFLKGSEQICRPNEREPGPSPLQSLHAWRRCSRLAQSRRRRNQKVFEFATHRSSESTASKPFNQFGKRGDIFPSIASQIFWVSVQVKPAQHFQGNKSESLSEVPRVSGAIPTFPE
jgi:hypothetical protein